MQKILLGTAQNQMNFQYNENLVKLILINNSIGMRDIRIDLNTITVK